MSNSKQQHRLAVPQSPANSGFKTPSLDQNLRNSNGSQLRKTQFNSQGSSVQGGGERKSENNNSQERQVEKTPSNMKANENTHSSKKDTLMSSSDLVKKGPVKIPLPYSKTKILQLPKIRDGEVTPDRMNPMTTDFKINTYYNTMMRDHFLFEQSKDNKEATDVSAKLKQRLQNRVNLKGNFRDGANIIDHANSVVPSPRQVDDLYSLVNNNRLTEMKNAQKAYIPEFQDQRRGLLSPSTAVEKQHPILNNKASFAIAPLLKQKTSGTAPASPRAKQSGYLEEQIRENMQTFYMIEAKEFMNQKRLGEFTLSKKENVLEKGQLLYDATKVMQMTQGYLKKNLLELMKKRKLNEAHSLALGQSKNQAVRDAQLLRQQFANFNQDEDVPYYLRDRRPDLYNPLKENRLTYTEMRVIEKMKKMGKWNEELMGPSDNLRPNDPLPPTMKKIDSLVESVFNSEKNLEWLPESGCPIKAPPPSIMSESDVNLFDSRADLLDKDDDQWMFGTDKDTKQDQTGENQQKSGPNDQQTANINGENSLMQMIMKDDQDMKKLLGDNEEDNPDDYFDSVIIDGIQLASIKHLGPYKVIQKSKDQAKKLNGKEPSPDTLAKIYRHYCNMVRLVPVPFLHLYKHGILKMPNFNLQAGLSIALSCVIPFMTELIGVKFVSNGIRDDEAAMLIRACSFCPNFQSFILEKNEVGEKFAYMLKEGIQILQGKFHELSLAQSRNFMKISSKVGLVAAEAQLHHLDLSNNTLNYIACKLLASMIKNTVSLQLLNLSNCGLRNTSAKEIANALLFNLSIKFLDLSVNSFASKDYDLASKLARMIQIHDKLVHLDLTSISLRREEAMYIAQCLNDSSNIVCCHLTGNNIDYYGRLFLRAHLNAIVQFPMINNQAHQQNVNTEDRGQIGAINNQIQHSVNDHAGQPYLHEKMKDPEYYMDLIARMKPEDLERLQKEMHEALEDIGIEESRRRASQEEGGETPIRGRRILSSMESETLSQQRRSISMQQHHYHDNVQGGGAKERAPSPLTKLSKFAPQHKQNFSGQAVVNQSLPVQQIRPRQTSVQPMSNSNGNTPALPHTKTLSSSKQQASLKGQSKLSKYLKDKESRIYDMFSMLDTYGFRRHVEEAKQNYLQKFPDTDLAQQFQDEEKKLGKLKSNKTSSLLMDQGFSSHRTKDQSQAPWSEAGTLNDQNAMARFIGGLVTHYDEKMPPHPMQGFLNEVIFARFIGHDDISHSHSWRDCSQCWICEKWDKCELQYYKPDIIDDSQFQKLFEISQTFEGGPFMNKLKRADDGKKKVKVEIVKDNTDNEIFEGDEYLIKPSGKVAEETKSTIALDDTSAFEMRSIMEVKADGMEKVTVNEVQDRVLYNQQINPTKIDLKIFQQKIVPTIAAIQNGADIKDLIVHQDCIPYKPFTKKAMMQALNNTCTPLNESALSPTPQGFRSNSPALNSVKSKGSGNLSSQKSKLRKRNNSEKPIVKKQSIDSDEGSSVENWSDDSQISKTSEERAEIQKNRLKFQFNNIFAEWWKFLPELKALGDDTLVDDIYVMASFNNWLPQRMEAYQKNLVLLQEPADKEVQTNKVKEQLKNLQIPQTILKAHVEKKYNAAPQQQQISENNEQNKEQQSEGQIVHTHSDSEFHEDEETKKYHFEPQMYRTITNLEEFKKYDESLIKKDIAYNHSKFIPSGKHYFYFIKDGKYYCLSDRYPIKKFKATNLYMNEIVIQPHTWHIKDFHIGEVLGIKKKAKFDISKSIFKTWKVETPELLTKMFDLDFKYTKIKKIFKNSNTECDNVKNLLEKHYVQIKNIFLGQVLHSDYPIVSWNDFTIMCNKCKIPDTKHCNLATIDRIYIATNVNQNIQGQQGDRDLVRYEFLEIIVRIANAKYKESGIFNNSVDAVKKLLDDNIFPNLEESIPQDFRENQLYTDDVNELLVRNEAGLKKLFGLYCHGQKKYMTVKDTIDLINVKAELRFLEKQIIKQFGLSKMPHMDQIANPEFPTRIIFVEFLEFIGRISFEYFRDHAGMKDEPLHMKIDALFVKLFKLVKFNKTYTVLDPSKQNVAYEVTLNPQLLGGAGLEKQPSQEKIQGFLNSDLDKIRETDVKFNL